MNHTEIRKRNHRDDQIRLDAPETKATMRKGFNRAQLLSTSRSDRKYIKTSLSSIVTLWIIYSFNSDRNFQYDLDSVSTALQDAAVMNVADLADTASAYIRTQFAVGDPRGSNAFDPAAQGTATMVPIPNNSCLQKCISGHGGKPSKLSWNDPNATEVRDILDRHYLVQTLLQAKEEMTLAIKDEFGEYFDKIFVQDDSETPGVGGSLFNRDKKGKRHNPFVPPTHHDPISSPGPSSSVELLKRKIMIKFLQAQLSWKQRTDCQRKCRSSFSSFSYSSSRPSSMLEDKKDTDHLDKDSFLSSFIYVAAGNMAAAGHGNLYNESYTGYMSTLVSPVFNSIGIGLVARNYAMGDEPSVPELSTCIDEIYGTDADILSYDFVMTESQKPGNSFEFGHAVISSQGRPALLGIDTTPRHIKSFAALETFGLDQQHTDDVKMRKKSTVPVFVSDPKLMKQMLDSYPDCLNMTTTECSEAYPQMVAGMKCGPRSDIPNMPKPELRQPCHSLKYSKEICPNRPEQVHWHRGFKENYLIGSSLALFLADALVGAAKDLAAHPEPDPQKLLDQLQKEEDDAYEMFRNADIDPPSLVSNNYRDDLGIDPIATFIKRPTICKSARLPSQSRFLGRLTNTDKRGDVGMFGSEAYDVGLEDVDALKTNSRGVMRLVWTMYNERVAAQKCAPDAILSPDYYDFWLTSADDGWNHLEFPNDAERIAYGYENHKFKGYVVVYPMAQAKDYYGGKKPLVGLAEDDFRQKKWEMKINGHVVTDLIRITKRGNVGGAPALIAVGTNGTLTFDSNEKQSYVIEIKVNEKDLYVRLRTVVVY